MSNIQIGLEIIAMFFVLVTLHEWGHFYFAKRAGILVREFAIGFGPKLFSYKKGETRYTLRILPIGGFVRMAGEDPETVSVVTGQTIGVRIKDGSVTHLFTDHLHDLPGLVIGTVESIDLERKLSLDFSVEAERLTYPVHPEAVIVSDGKETQIAPWNRQFGSKTVGKRALSIFAGPLMNFLLAFVLFMLFVGLHGIANDIKLTKLSPGMPAEKAGLKPGDIVLQVNNETIGTDSDRLVGLIRSSANKPMQWVVQRAGKQETFSVTPTQDGDKILVGIELGSDSRSPSAGEVVSGAATHMALSTKAILTGFKMIVLGNVKMDDLGGPVRIVEVSSEFAKAGIDSMVGWSAMLSLYLGLFNLLPIPALDGSRLVFLGIEGVRGKPVDPSRESMVHFIGFAMLMLLMIAVTYNDILRLIKG